MLLTRFLALAAIASFSMPAMAGYSCVDLRAQMKTIVVDAAHTRCIDSRSLIASMRALQSQVTAFCARGDAIQQFYPNVTTDRETLSGHVDEYTRIYTAIFNELAALNVVLEPFDMQWNSGRVTYEDDDDDIGALEQEMLNHVQTIVGLLADLRSRSLLITNSFVISSSYRDELTAFERSRGDPTYTSIWRDLLATQGFVRQQAQSIEDFARQFILDNTAIHPLALSLYVHIRTFRDELTQYRLTVSIGELFLFQLRGLLRDFKNALQDEAETTLVQANGRFQDAQSLLNTARDVCTPVPLNRKVVLDPGNLKKLLDRVHRVHGSEEND